MSDEHRLLRAFLEETEELLEKLNHCLLELEKDSANLELVHEIFRLTHSLKSESAMIGFANLSELAHRLEDVFERLRSGALLLGRELLDAVLGASDLIQEMVTRVARGEGDDGVDTRLMTAELSRLAGIAGGRAAPAPRGQAPAGEPLMRHPRAYLVLSNLERVANVLKSSPELDKPPAEEDGEGYAEVQILFSSDLPEAELSRAYRLEDIAEAELARLDPAALGAGPREDGPRAEGGRAPSGESPPPEASAPRGDYERSARASVRVDTAKLDDLWQLVGELVTCKARFGKLTGGLAGGAAGPAGSAEMLLGVEKITDSLEQVTGRMQQAVMETRMVPIAVLFNKFPRLVRDLSRKLGKDVELAMTGGETEIDRSLVEAVSDPLTHLIRNSLDHGIETVEQRIARGKPATGRISISAQQRGGKIVIEVVDDGRGLDLDRIRQVAQAAPETTDAELINFIFQPGFSTRQSVSELSGRGVGLDVVATRVKESLRGEVLISNLPGRGLTVTILLPLTLTILHSLLVASAGQYYAIPIRDIDETVQVEPIALRPTRFGEQMALGEEEIPAIRLSRLLEAPPASPAGEPSAAATSAPTAREPPPLARAPGEGGYLHGVVARSKGQRYCLLVDELVEELDLVIKPLAEVLNRHRLFSGVSVLGDGRIVFILDTSRIVELPE
jgi:two-component system chemotaxis sensor kinase CheA